MLIYFPRITRKKRAKVLLFFELCKYFAAFFDFFAKILLFANWTCLFEPISLRE